MSHTILLVLLSFGLYFFLIRGNPEDDDKVLEIVNRVRKLAKSFLDQLGPIVRLYASDISRHCTHKCGEMWLLCFKQPTCTVDYVEGCGCERIVGEDSPGISFLELSVEEHLKRFGVSEQDIALVRRGGYSLTLEGYDDLKDL
jgi:hypothetical protein